MADKKKRFTIGNTTVNLDKIHASDLQMDFCVKYNTLPYCANHITKYEIPEIPGLCAYHTLNITLTGCHGVTLPRTTWITDRIRTVELTPRLTIEDVSVLKEQLKEDLHAVEAHEAVVRSAEAPKTVEEMDVVEEKLKESLAEIQQLKEELAAKK